MSHHELPVYPGWITEKELGRGSFGGVYQIRRMVGEDIERRALKVISIPTNESEIRELRQNDWDQESITEYFGSQKQNVLKEYMLMRKLNGNTNVVNCDDVSAVQHADEIGWDIYILMELLTPMADAVPVVVDDRQAIKIAMDLCNALILCERNHIIHRDIKPQNIFVSDNGDYKLGDFGIARTIESATQGASTVGIGTYNYMAPEVRLGKPYSHTADIYSLGLVLYWLLNERRLPFYPMPPARPTREDFENAQMRRMRGDAIPEPKHGCRGVKDVIIKCCAYEASNRYQSAHELMRALKKLDASLNDSEQFEEPTEPNMTQGATVRVQKKTAPILTKTEVVDSGNGTVVEQPIGAHTNLKKPNRPALDKEPVVNADVESPSTEAAKPKKTGLIVGFVAVIALVIGALVIFGGGGSSIEAKCQKLAKDGLYLEAIYLIEDEITAGNEDEALPGLLEEYRNAFVAEELDYAEWIYEETQNRLAAIESIQYAYESYPDERFQAAINDHKIAMNHSSISAGGGYATVIRENGSVVASGENVYNQCATSSLSNIVSVSSGDCHLVALTDTGRVVVLGLSKYGLHNANNWTDIAAVVAGDYSILALTKDGKLKSVGEEYKQHNVEQLYGDQPIVGIAAGYKHNVVLYADGTVKAIGNNKYGQLNVEHWTDIVAICAGSFHTVGLRSDGTVVATGG
ncbi:MAG: protein kinase, partial [Oscillospiraceae bacterium]|nr:protein kinase [Oscillospiraceae bacterium]